MLDICNQLEKEFTIFHRAHSFDMTKGTVHDIKHLNDLKYKSPIGYEFDKKRSVSCEYSKLILPLP
jgi:hypothetical protein